MDTRDIIWGKNHLLAKTGNYLPGQQITIQSYALESIHELLNYAKENFITANYFFFVSTIDAQVEVAHLSSKGFSANGFGAFLNFTVPVTEYGAVSAEAGFYYFKKGDNNVALVPFLLGYRYMLQDPEAGFYVEPNAGYNIGGSDIQKYDENGNVVFDPVTGNLIDQQVKGFTTGLGAGYIFSGTFAFNLGLRYQRVFVSGDPSLNLYSLRISHPISFKRRE